MKLLDILDTGKKAPVWKSTNFDAGLYDITGFFRTDIISINYKFSDIWFLQEISAKPTLVPQYNILYIL